MLPAFNILDTNTDSKTECFKTYLFLNRNHYEAQT